MNGCVCSTVVRVRYAETDQMGYAYHANYLAWFEVGRCEWLRSLGSSYRDMETRDGIMLPVIEAHCQYRHPSRYDDELEIRARGELVSLVRVRFQYEVVRVCDGVHVAGGYTLHASTDLGGRPKRLPSSVRALFGQANRRDGASEPVAASAPPGRDVE